MRIDQQPAFILHARAYRETSLLLEAFTRDHGRVGLVARGVRKEKTRQPRALLQPLVPLTLSWTGAGELATLVGAEGEGEALALAGEGLLCGLYLNELLLRMTERADPHAPLFDAYALALRRLAGAEPASWTLRRFERDLLDQLGYGIDLATDAQSGSALEADAGYGYRHEIGIVPWRGAADGPRVAGSALLALALDRQPDDAQLPALRRLLRHVISGHLPGGELQSWKLLADAPLRRGE
jgi:DNA repair protein RecO (recombination protein O)